MWNEIICRLPSWVSLKAVEKPLQEKAARGGMVALANDILAGIERLYGPANALERVLLVIRENEDGFQLADEQAGVEGLGHGDSHAVVTGGCTSVSQPLAPVVRHASDKAM